MSEYAVGPPPHPSPGPVLAVYADTDALERDCPTCGVLVAQYCVHPSGVVRKTPCHGRGSK